MQNNQSAIAIVGMSGRFPGAKNIEEFWKNLYEGTESISFFTNEELEAGGIDQSILKKANYVKAKGIIHEIDMFDANFFGFNPREAEIMDPQHRLFLECSWEAVESAGYNLKSYDGHIGVYAGGGVNTYLLSNLISNPNAAQSFSNLEAVIGNSSDHLSTRVAYKLGLRGPAITIQTACSTSLVAVHLACQSLLLGECDMALAGGVNISVPQKSGYLYEEGMIFSPDGHCRAFDIDAKGTVGSDGLGVVVLKRLQDAIDDRDNLYCVIKGSAVNNDGSYKVGYTAPGLEGQVGVIAEAQAVADVQPETITYVETHGTGTALGDPIEIEALTQAFQTGTDKKNYCAIGSLKTNIGHLNAAAGVAGLIKTALALKHKVIPPSLHFTEPNPKINIVDSPFYVNKTQSQWETNGMIRRASVSSFGIGGTNAHVVLEEAPHKMSSEESPRGELLLLSAKTESALEDSTDNLIEFLRSNSHINFADLVYTLKVGREEFLYRRMCICEDIDSAIDILSTMNTKETITNPCSSITPSVTFRFAVLDSDCSHIGSEVYKRDQLFKLLMNECADILKQYIGLDICQTLYVEDMSSNKIIDQLQQMRLIEIAEFTINYALARRWINWGISPNAMMSYGISEYVAACISGVISLEDVLMLMSIRRNLLTGIEDLHEITHNTKDQLMTPYERILGYAKNVKLNTPEIPYMSNVTGTWIENSVAIDPTYWAKQLGDVSQTDHREEQLSHSPDSILIEIGSYSSRTSMLSILGKLWLSGIVINWSEYYTYENRYRIPCPTYAFERKRVWIGGVSIHGELSDGGTEVGHIGHIKSNQRRNLYQRPDLYEEYIAPRNKYEKVIVDIWQDVLGIDKIGVLDDFFDLGGDSILAPTLIARLREHFQVEYPLDGIFDSPTVEETAIAIEDMENEEEKNHINDAINEDLHNEVVLDESISAIGKRYKHIENPSAIFITGATGFLGAHLLDELLHKTHSDVYCLVRATHVEEGMKRIRKNLETQKVWDDTFSSRIIPVVGDLSKTNLGINITEFEDLAKRIDTIYHCGAWVNFTYPYKALKDTNVMGTQEVLRLASQEKVKPVHFVSTLAIFDSVDYSDVKVIYEDDPLDYCTGLQIGYAQSKWVAEKLIMIARGRGIPTSIYRLGLIGGHSITGVANMKDLVWSVIKACIQVGGIPDNATSPLDIVPVDFVSRGIVHLSLSENSAGKSFNFSNPYQFTWEKLFSWIQDYGYPLLKMDQRQWIHHVMEGVGQSANALNPFAPILYRLISSEIDSEVAASSEGGQRRIDCSYTNNQLTNASITCPKVDEQLLNTYFKYFIDCGFLDAPINK